MKKFRSIITIVILLLVYILYSYYRVNKVCEFPPIKLLVEIIDTIAIKINVLFSNIVDTFKNYEVIKWLMIFILAFYLIYRLDINSLISNISEIKLKDLLVKMKAEELSDDEIKKRDELEKSSPNKNSSEIEKIDKRIEIIDLIKRYPYIAQLLEKWIKKKIFRTNIPLSKITDEGLNLAIINNIFEYELKGNTVIISDLKAEYKEEIIEVYNELTK